MVKKRVKRHVPPSRIRYEESHPIIAIRVPRQIHDQLVEIREKTDQSWADLMNVALKLQEPVLTRKPDQKELDKAFEEGLEEGWKEYSIVFPCSKCGKDIIVNSENKQLIIQHLRNSGLKHKKCQ